MVSPRMDRELTLVPGFVLVGVLLVLIVIFWPDTSTCYDPHRDSQEWKVYCEGGK